MSLFPLARPHNGLLLGPGHISSPGSALVPVASPCFPRAPGHRLSDPASPLVSFS